MPIIYHICYYCWVPFCLNANLPCDDTWSLIIVRILYNDALVTSLIDQWQHLFIHATTFEHLIEESACKIVLKSSAGILDDDSRFTNEILLFPWCFVSWNKFISSTSLITLSKSLLHKLLLILEELIQTGHFLIVHDYPFIDNCLQG
jgi:hypothetical protein